MNKKENELENVFIDPDAGVIFTDLKEIKRTTNWFDWDDKYKVIFAKQWQKLEDDFEKEFGDSKYLQNHIVENEYVVRTINLLSELEKDDYLTNEYFSNFVSREEVNDYLTSYDKDNNIDALDKSRHTRTIQDPTKEFYKQDAYKDFRNITLEDLVKPLEEIGNSSITPSMDFRDLVDEVLIDDLKAESKGMHL